MMATNGAALPIDARRLTVPNSPTLTSARQPPAPLGSLRLTSPPSTGSSGRMRWADITPGAQGSLGSSAFGSGVYGSGAFRAPTSRGDAPAMIFPSTPSPWPSMKTYQFGSIRSPTLTPATEISPTNGSVSVSGIKTMSTGTVSLSPATTTSGSPVLDHSAPYPAPHQQMIMMPMPMQTVQPIQQPVPIAVQQPSTVAPMMMLTAPGMPGQVNMTYQVQPGVTAPAMVQTVMPTMSEQDAQAHQQAVAMLQSGAIPSIGSALHASAKCSPCAWFWKKGGCQNAQNCTYCHLCPEGELKNRKKAKVAAIRMGALQPATVVLNGSTTVTAQPAKLRLSTLVDS